MTKKHFISLADAIREYNQDSFPAGTNIVSPLQNTFYVIQNIRYGYIKAKLTNRSEADTLCSRLNAELNYAHDRYKVVTYHA